MRVIQLTVRDFLDQHDLSVYRVVEAAKGRVARSTLYALAAGEVSRVDLRTLGAVATVLQELTQQEIEVSDLLKATTVPEPDAESQTWLNADLAPTLPPYEWGEEGLPDIEPVQYVPGQGFIVGES